MISWYHWYITWALSWSILWNLSGARWRSWCSGSQRKGLPEFWSRTCPKPDRNGAAGHLDEIWRDLWMLFTNDLWWFMVIYIMFIFYQQLFCSNTSPLIQFTWAWRGNPMAFGPLGLRQVGHQLVAAVGCSSISSPPNTRKSWSKQWKRMNKT